MWWIRTEQTFHDSKAWYDRSSTMNESKLWFSNQMIVVECWICIAYCGKRQLHEYRASLIFRSLSVFRMFLCRLQSSMVPIELLSNLVTISNIFIYKCSLKMKHKHKQNMPNVIGKVSQNNFYCLFPFINLAIIFVIIHSFI